MIARLETLPAAKRQPNLLFSAVRFLDGPVTEPQQVTYTINPAAVWSDGTLVARSRITG